MVIDANLVRPLISLTAHERIDILVAQICNLLDHYPAGGRVVVHRSSEWIPLASAEEEAWWEGALAELPGVILNPERMVTRWAHMFHAHVSNIRLALAADPEWTTLVLHSSADLMVRQGVERTLGRFDYGGAIGLVKPTTPWMWAPFIFGDALFMQMAGSRPIRASMHEGTFYQRSLAAAMLAEIDAHVTDWDYDDQYPKEEMFFPTLAGERGLNAGPKYAYLLRFNQTLDPMVVSLALRMLRSSGAEESDAMAAAIPDWPHVPFGCMPRDLYSIGRLPRDRDHALRRAVMAESALWRDVGGRGGARVGAVGPLELAADFDVWTGSSTLDTATAALAALQASAFFLPAPLLGEEGRWFPDTGGKPENRFQFAGVELRTTHAPPHAAVILRPGGTFMGVQTLDLGLHAWRISEEATARFVKWIKPRSTMTGVALIVGASAEERRTVDLHIEHGEDSARLPARRRIELKLSGDAVLLLWLFEDVPVNDVPVHLVFDPGPDTERLTFAGPVVAPATMTGART